MNNILAKNIPAKENLIKNKHAGYLLVKIIIAAGLLLFIIRKINPEAIFSAVSAADYNLIILSFALSFLNLYLQYLKWETVCGNFLNISNKKKIFISLFHGFAAGIFTPARIGEYFSRGLVLKDKSVFQIAAATFIDKFFPLLPVAFFGGISFIFYLKYYFQFPFFISSLLFFSAVIITYFLLSQIFKGKFLKIIPDKIRLNKKFERILSNIEQLDKLNFRFILKMSFISIAFYFCYLLQFAILISAFSHSFKFIQYLWNGSLVMFSKSIIPQISIGELGIREGFSVYFFSKIGETAATAFNASFFLFLINLVFPSLLGLILLYKKSYD